MSRYVVFTILAKKLDYGKSEKFSKGKIEIQQHNWQPLYDSYNFVKGTLLFNVQISVTIWVEGQDSPVKIKVHCVKTVNNKETQVKIQGSSNNKNKGRLC